MLLTFHGPDTDGYKLPMDIFSIYFWYTLYYIQCTCYKVYGLTSVSAGWPECENFWNSHYFCILSFCAIPKSLVLIFHLYSWWIKAKLTSAGSSRGALFVSWAHKQHYWPSYFWVWLPAVAQEVGLAQITQIAHCWPQPTVLISHH
jgi:hypothetical protein